MSSIFSMDLLNLLFKNSNDAVFFMEKTDEKYRYIFVNDAAVTLINTNPCGKTIDQVIPSQVAKTIIHHYDLTIEQNKQVEFEDFTYEKMNVRKQRTTTIPIVQDGKQYILAMTKEVSMSLDLEDKYLFMRSLFSNSFLSTILVSNDLQFLEANTKFLEEFNIQTEDASRLSILDMPFIDRKTAKKLKSYIKRTQLGENVQSKMLFFNDKHNEKRCFTASFSSLTSNGENIAVFIILQEITEFIKQGQALRTASHGLEMFKNAINSFADVIFTDVDGTIMEVNERVIESTGYTRDELIGKPYHFLHSTHQSDSASTSYWQKVSKEEIWRDEVCHRKKNGDIYWVDSTMIPLKNEPGNVEQFLMVQYNISSEKQLMSDLYIIERNFRAITENTNDFIVVTDRYGKIKYASPSYSRKLGYLEEELIGVPYDELLKPESVQLWHEALNPETVDLVEEQKIELLLYKKDNSTIWTEGNYTLTFDLTNHEMTEIVMVSREITERKQLEDQLTYLAYHDSLTQLGNRRKLYKDFPLLKAEADETGTCLAILYLDGDNFKQVNDVYGHDVGDEFLIEFGKSLVRSVRNEDLVIRLGGDEFLIVLTGLSLYETERSVQLAQIMDRIKENLQIGWMIRGSHFSPTASMGLSIYPGHSVNLDVLIDLADQALYKAKQSSN